MIRTAPIAFLTVLALTACGGSSEADSTPQLEDWEISSLRADAFSLSTNAAQMCVDPSDSPLSWGEITDKLLDLNKKLPEDPRIREAIRGAAEAMRTCGDSSQADRLNRATD